MVRTARTASEFAEAVEAALDVDRDRGAARERMRFGLENTWEERASEALSLIEDRLAALRGRGPGGADRGGGRAAVKRGDSAE